MYSYILAPEKGIMNDSIDNIFSWLALIPKKWCYWLKESIVKNYSLKCDFLRKF